LVRCVCTHNGFHTFHVHFRCYTAVCRSSHARSVATRLPRSVARYLPPRAHHGLLPHMVFVAHWTPPPPLPRGSRTFLPDMNAFACGSWTLCASLSDRLRSAYTGSRLSHAFGYAHLTPPHAFALHYAPTTRLRLPAALHVLVATTHFPRTWFATFTRSRSLQRPTLYTFSSRFATLGLQLPRSGSWFTGFHSLQFTTLCTYLPGLPIRSILIWLLYVHSLLWFALRLVWFNHCASFSAFSFLPFCSRFVAITWTVCHTVPLTFWLPRTHRGWFGLRLRSWLRVAFSRACAHAQVSSLRAVALPVRFTRTFTARSPHAFHRSRFMRLRSFTFALPVTPHTTFAFSFDHTLTSPLLRSVGSCLHLWLYTHVCARSHSFAVCYTAVLHSCGLVCYTVLTLTLFVRSPFRCWFGLVRLFLFYTRSLSHTPRFCLSFTPHLSVFALTLPLVLYCVSPPPLLPHFTGRFLCPAAAAVHA